MKKILIFLGYVISGLIMSLFILMCCVVMGFDPNKMDHKIFVWSVTAIAFVSFVIAGLKDPPAIK